MCRMRIVGSSRITQGGQYNPAPEFEGERELALIILCG
jgi:hypothetical protein